MGWRTRRSSSRRAGDRGVDPADAFRRMRSMQNIFRKWYLAPIAATLLVTNACALTPSDGRAENGAASDESAAATGEESVGTAALPLEEAAPTSGPVGESGARRRVWACTLVSGEWWCRWVYLK
jgi:hypothetical protein